MRFELLIADLRPAARFLIAAVVLVLFEQGSPLATPSRCALSTLGEAVRRAS
jgi:hypothetical protein